MSLCSTAHPLHILDSLTYSVPLVLKRQCDRTLGEECLDKALTPGCDIIEASRERPSPAPALPAPAGARHQRPAGNDEHKLHRVGPNRGPSSWLYQGISVQSLEHVSRFGPTLRNSRDGRCRWRPSDCSAGRRTRAPTTRRHVRPPTGSCPRSARPCQPPTGPRRAPAPRGRGRAEREIHRAGADLASWANILTGNPHQRREVGPAGLARPAVDVTFTRQGCGGDALDDRVLYLHGGVYIYYAPGELGLRPSSGGSWPASRARPSSRAAGPHAIAGLKRWC